MHELFVFKVAAHLLPHLAQLLCLGSERINKGLLLNYNYAELYLWSLYLFLVLTNFWGMLLMNMKKACVKHLP